MVNYLILMAVYQPSIEFTQVELNNTCIW